MDYINIESENQKSGLIILLVLFHSAYPYKNYCLKCFTELQTLFIYLFKFFFFFYLVCNYLVIFLLVYIYIYIFFFFFSYYNILPLTIVGVYNRYHRDIHIFVQKSGGTEIE